LASGSASGSAQVSLTCFGAPATIVGTEGSDNITGTAGPDVIVSLGGVDLIASGAGDDRVCAGPGNDVALLEEGNDSWDGGDGVDNVDGGPGDDMLVGGAGEADGVTHITARGPVSVNLATGVATGAGRDTLSQIESASGSDFDDTLVGNAGINVLNGSAGRDRLDGAAHSDALIGAAGDDTMIGHPGEGDSAAYPGAPTGVQADLQTGTATGEGRDTLTDIESLIGSDHGDRLAGNGGFNFLLGLGGNDVLAGRGGFDVAFFPTNPVTASLAAGRSQGEGNDTLTGFEGLAGSPGADRLVGDGKQNYLEGDEGNDVIDAGGGPDVAFGKRGADRLDGGAGDDKLFGGPGDDTLSGGAGAADTVSYIDSASAVRADLGTNTATGEGSDRLSGVESLSGSAFTDELTGDSRANRLFGNDGDDRLVAGGGADFVGGGGGTDIIEAGAGRDYCLDDQRPTACEISGAPSIPGAPEPPPVAQPHRWATAGPAGLPTLGQRRDRLDLLAWMARTARDMDAVAEAMLRGRAQLLVAPRNGPPPAFHAAATVRETAAYEYGAEPVCISAKRGGLTEIAPPNAVGPVGDDGGREEAWWQGTLFRQDPRTGRYTKRQAKTGWARAQLGGDYLLPGVVVWKDVSGRRGFRSPVALRVPPGRYVWKGQIYWARSGGRIFAPVEPHIIRKRTIRHDKNCDFR
jgi:Ca2+-binding RTX toxin-like protein